MKPSPPMTDPDMNRQEIVALAERVMLAGVTCRPHHSSWNDEVATQANEIEAVFAAIGVEPASSPPMTDHALEPMARALERCKLQFLEYERQHRAKGTEEASRKADTNQRMATMCAEALASTPPREHLACPNCNRSEGFAIVDERKPDGHFGPGPERRCVHCKFVFTPPRAHEEQRERVARIIVETYVRVRDANGAAWMPQVADEAARDILLALVAEPDFRTAQSQNDRQQVDAKDAPSRWRPIESAPRDGTVVLLWLDQSRYVVAAWGSPGVDEDTSEEDEGWIANNAWARGEDERPTHWRFPPPPPVGGVAVHDNPDDSSGLIKELQADHAEYLSGKVLMSQEAFDELTRKAASPEAGSGGHSLGSDVATDKTEMRAPSARPATGGGDG